MTTTIIIGSVIDDSMTPNLIFVILRKLSMPNHPPPKRIFPLQEH